MANSLADRLVIRDDGKTMHIELDMSSAEINTITQLIQAGSELYLRSSTRYSPPVAPVVAPATNPYAAPAMPSP